MDVRDRVLVSMKDQLSTIFGVDAASITDDTDFEADLGAKSGNMTMMLTKLEDEFDVEIPYMKVMRAKTVGATASFVADLLDE